MWFLAACSAPVRWQTFTQPMTSPAGSRSALMSMRRSSRAPSLQARRVANEIWSPARMRSSTALCSAASSAGMIGGSVPTTSSAVQPNIRSAAGFQSRTVRSVPNATIASAALSTTARAVASTRSRPATARCCVTASSCHCLAGQSQQGTRSQGAGPLRRPGRGLLDPPFLPGGAGTGGDLQAGAVGGGIPRVGQAQPGLRVHQADPAPDGDRQPLLRAGPVAGPQVNRGATGRAAVLNVQALPTDPHGAVGPGGPLLGAGAVAGRYVDLGAVRRLAPAVVHALARDLR